ncbi:MAG: hypothetical protein KBC64_07440 [Simkaniaceae bacterium]|nr:hypothetical protein [Simkaniaceae bacterium]
MNIKKIKLWFFVFVFIFCEGTETTHQKEPGICLNCQDVPTFFDGNPLAGLNAFAVIPPCSIQNVEVNKKITAIIKKELSVIGNVIKPESEDVVGFASGTLLSIRVGGVSKWNGGELPISRVTLSVGASITMNRTNLQSHPNIWSINGFIDSPFDSKSEELLVGAIQKLLTEFVENYRSVNINQSKKPTFYLY